MSVPAVADDKNPGEGLATAIMSHLHARFPSMRVSVASEGPRVRQFANEVVSKCIFQVQPGQLEAAAIAAIDSANVESSSVSSVVRAAMSGVLESIGHGAKLMPPVENMKPDGAHASFYDTGTIRVIRLPTLIVREDFDDPTYSSCSGFKKYFDFSKTSITGIVLDLRGNPGGMMYTVECIASALLEPGRTLLTTATTTEGLVAIQSRELGWHGPVTLPVAIFIDKDTDQGAIALAAGLQDQQRARIIGEQRTTVNGTVTSLLTSTGFPIQDWFLVPTGDMRHVGGQRFATTGARIDVSVSPSDEEALLAAARAGFVADTH